MEVSVVFDRYCSLKTSSTGSAILQVAGCGLRVAGHKYKMSPVAMHTLKLNSSLLFLNIDKMKVW
jgi:hypothetical protein